MTMIVSHALPTAWPTYDEALTAKPGCAYIVDCEHGYVPCTNEGTAVLIHRKYAGRTIYRTL